MVNGAAKYDDFCMGLHGRNDGCTCRYPYKPYIMLFTRHVLSAISSLESCIKSTRVNFSRNPSESLKSTIFAKLCQIYVIELFTISILS